MLKIKKKTFSIATVAIFIFCLNLLCANNQKIAQAAGTVFVATTGTNNSTCGIFSNPPCRTIEYAVEQRAQYGDLVSINDGTYSEAQIAVPEGVSLTSTSANNAKVHLRPSVSLDSWYPLVKLSSASPGSAGNQSISYLEIDGVNGSIAAKAGIQVKNRNNVRVHHCNIHDFKGDAYCYGVDVFSSQIDKTNEWWRYAPVDQQSPGTDDNINLLWPTNPVENFELDNNLILDCGYKGSVDIIAPAVGVFNLKNSTIHNNYIDTRNSGYGEPIYATSAFLWNVDIYSNTLLMPEYTDRSSYPIEIWNLRNGCQIYDNISNSGFSIAYGKETTVYNNQISKSSGHIGYAIEFTGQTYGRIYNNIISGGSGYGIHVGHDQNNDNKSYIFENIWVYGNVIHDTRYHPIRITADNDNSNTNTIVRDVYFYNNTIDTNRTAGYNGIYLSQSGQSILSNINIKNNIVSNLVGSDGEKRGTVTSLTIDRNGFYNNSGSFSNFSPTNSLTTNPLYRDRNNDDFALQNTSSYIDAGIDVALPFSGIAPDLGAIEYLSSGDTTPPSAPQGLSVE